MGKRTDAFSMESVTAQLFGNVHTNTGLYGLESEDLTPTEKATITDEPVETEITADDVEAGEADADQVGTRVTVIVDEVGNNDPEVLATECYRIMGEVQLLSLALRSTESFIWSKEEEATVDPVKKDNIIIANAKKFWEFCKKIFEKIKAFVVQWYRRAQIWIVGEGKKYAEFYKKNQKETAKIEGSDVELKTKVPLLDAKQINNIDLELQGVANTISGFGFNAANAENKGLAEGTDANSVKSITSKLYGEGAVEAVKASAFFAKYKLADLADMGGVKTSLSTLQVAIKAASSKIGECAKESNSKETNKEVLKTTKEIASTLHKALNAVSSSAIYLASQKIALANTAVRFANKALGGKKETTPETTPEATK